jgi:hypothetical protein
LREVDLSHLPAGMVQKVDARGQELAADFLKKFTSTQKVGAKVYFSHIRSQDPFVPPRAGYRLGTLVVRELAKRNSIPTMTHWSQKEARPKIQAALEAIAQARAIEEH